MKRKIEKENVEEIFELSLAQSGMLFHYLKDVNDNLFNVQLSFSIEGIFDINILEQSIIIVQSKNEVLRSVFRWEEVNKPVQIILKKCPVSLIFHDVSQKETKDISGFVENYLIKDQCDRFDLTTLPLRISIIKTSNNAFILIITHHHILYDGWSTGIFLKELFFYYNQIKNNQRPNFIDKSSYKIIQKTLLRNRPSTEAELYWKDYLKDHEITSSIIKKHVENNKIEHIQKFCISLSNTKIETFASNHKLTKASIIYAAYGILIQKYNDKSDIVFGTTVSNRDATIKDIDKAIGNFINTIPLRLENIEEKTLLEVITCVHEDLINRNKFCSTSYAKIKELLNLKPAENLFDSVIVVENYPLEESLINSSNDFYIKLKSVYENTDIPLLITVFFRDEIEIEFAYKKSVISDVFVKSYANHFITIINEILKHPEKNVGQFCILSEKEKHQLLFEFNDTKVDYPDDRTIIDIFENQLEKTPGNIAIRYGDKTISYQSLKLKYDKIAFYLRDVKGVRVGDLVGLMLEREEYLIPFILGILKVGGTYIPIDPNYPAERKISIIEDSKINVLITRSKYLNIPGKTISAIVELDKDLPAINDFEPKLSKIPISSKNLAYIIYTSGSTGKPKGVMIEHHSVINRIVWMQKVYPIHHEDVLIQKTPITFDVSVWELFWWFFSGASLCVLNPGEEKDPKELIDAIKKNKVTTIHFVPSMLSAFLSALNSDFNISNLKSLRQVFSSGEALKMEHVKLFAKSIYEAHGTRLINLYGPTEATVDVSYYECTFEEKHITVPIGKPIDNIRLYVMNKANQMAPMGMLGELCIAGVGLARGYLNNIKLTEDKFVYSPNIQGERIYKTGDLVKLRPDGNIEFLGRNDDQIKIRGFRIELGEIESQLVSHEKIKETVILVKEKEEQKYLVAYYVSEKEIEVTELRSYLSKNLPEYMVPAFYIHIKAIPLKTAGKIDKKALPELIIKLEEDYTSASSDLEENLMKIWAEVLGHDKISINKNFFDIGGDSLKLISVSSKIKKVFKQDISVTDLFNYPTIFSLANFVSSKYNTLKQSNVKNTKTKITKLNEKIEPDSCVSDIAIIGIAARFPGADNVNEFWENLKSGKESITRKEDPENLKVYAKGFLDRFDFFDAEFFGYNPSDVKSMDPQIRLIHECVWEALENAGYCPHNYDGKIGLYAGASISPYYNLNIDKSNDDDFFEKWVSLSFADKDFLCSRVSYALNLKGPSVNITTACSTSLVAIDTACTELLANKCEIAVAGGVSITLHDNNGYIYQDGMILSPDGKCKAFDENAAGTVSGNGVGIVALKKLKDALQDGDVIHAVIKGTAINNDGNQKVSFSAPSIQGQSKVIEAAIAKADINSESITYIEAHGTGTKLGDPIEIEALTKAFDTNKKKYCALGSVKTNIGHLDAAAGVAGLIKTVLSLKNKQILPNIHFKNPNKKIDFENSPFYVSTELKKWKADKYPLRAGVSSFGIGGTNAHVILEEAPKQEPSSDSRPYQLLLVSAKTETALENNIEKLKEHLKSKPNLNLADIAYTLQIGRIHFPYRKMIVCSNQDEAIELFSTKKQILPLAEKRGVNVFMFSGQGSQYVNMCRDLYENESSFKDEVDRCFGIVKHISGKDLKAVIFPNDKLNDTADINDTEYTQPLIFIIEYALSQFFLKLGIEPDIMIGHSIGEYAAACVSGVFSLEGALALVIKRGELMQKVASGKMLTVNISENDILPILESFSDISLAAVNSSRLCVVSGTEGSINTFKEHIDSKGYTSKIIRTSHAFHSSMMDDVTDAFKKEVSGIKINPQKIPFISNLTGNPAKDHEISDPQYWADHLRKTVRFSEGLESILKNEDATFIELGPGNVLGTFVRSNENIGKGHKVINVVRHPQEITNDISYLLSGLGKLWERGIEPDWDSFYVNEKRKRQELPSYQFDKKRHPLNKNVESSLINEQTLKRSTNISQWFYVPSWKSIPLISNSKCEKVNCNLLFADAYDVCKELAEKFNNNGEKVIWIKRGTCFEEESSSSYKVDPISEKDFISLFERLSQQGLLPDRIIYSWGIDKKTDNDFSQEKFSELKDRYLYGLHNIVKVGSNGSKLGEQIILLTNDLLDIHGNEDVVLAKSIPLGLLKVISQEYPTVSTSHIDITLSENLNDNFIERLFNEIRNNEPGKTVALRNSKRWLKTFTKIRSEKTPVQELLNNQNNGVYLITGGLGILGYSLSKYILKSFKAILILTGRTLLPPEKDWEKYLQNSNAPSNVKEKINRIISLRKYGSKVIYLPCDISNKSEFLKTTAIVEKQYGQVKGVIHAAGIIGGDSINYISELGKANYEFQFKSKISGLHVLKEVFGEKKLDFCIVISSLSSILGGLKFAAYSSANTYMDYFINFYHGKSEIKNWTCVNVDGLNLMGEGGNGINSKEIDDVFERILSFTDLPQIIISVADLDKRIEWGKQEINQDNIYEDQELHDKKEISISNKGESASQTLTAVLGLWQNLFGITEIDIDDDFFELGGDSLKALTIIGRINKLFNVKLNVKEIFNNPSIRKLTDFIDSKRENINSSSERDQIHSLINKAPTKESYLLSSAQNRMFFLYEFDKTSLVYNLPKIMKIKGIIDKTRLNDTMNKLLARHESLRTFFEVTNKGPIQKILEKVIIEIEYFNSSEDKIQSIINDFIRPFDLSKAPLIRAGLIEISSLEYIFMIDTHHIINDGVSEQIMIKDFMALYSNENLSELRLQYRDYAEWQQKEQQQEIDEQKVFWLNEFSEEVTPLKLPTDFRRPSTRSFNGSKLKFEIGFKEMEQLKLIAKNEKASLFMVLLSIYNILLSKLTNNQEDIIVGTVESGRYNADMEDIIGLFVNTLGLRNFPKGKLSFRDFLSDLKTKTLACFNNQSYPYENLIEELNIPRDPSRNPLFDTLFVVQNIENTELMMPGIKLKPYDYDHCASPFDIFLLAIETNDKILMRFEYCTKLFKKETIGRFIDYFMKIVADIIADINIKISDIEIITEEEKSQLLNKFNNTKVDYPKEETIISLFENQVEKTPENTALRCKNNNISYKELNDKSEQIAAYLINVHGVKSGDFIGILLDLEEYTITSILGILKAGCAYVPLETNYPAKRINSIAESSRLKVIITRHQYQIEPLTIKSNFVNVDEIFDYTHNELNSTLDAEVSPNHFAIEIFIPDSSGKSIGIKIKHSSIVNYSYWADNSYIKYEKATIPLFTPITSYLSISSIFVPLITGNTICIYAKDEKYSQIDNILNDNNVNIIKLAPSHLKLIKDSNYLKLKTYKSKIKHIIVSGGQLSSKLAKEILDLFNGDVDIYSEYVLMEEKLGCTFYKFEPDSIKNKFIPLGQPINNFQIYILDKYLKPVPKGVLGELYISSNGLANEDESNQLNIKEETITNAFFQGKSIHKTNEHAKWTANGNVEIIESNQRHVYINEAIVNLQELEYYIKEIENIKDCYVTIKTSNEIGSFLSAYILVSKSINFFPVINELLNKISKNTIPKELHIVDNLNEIKNINSFDIDSLLEYENKYVQRKIDVDEFTIDEKSQITEEKQIENDFKF